MGAPGRRDAGDHIADWEQVLEAFEADVFRRTLPSDAPGSVPPGGLYPTPDL